MVDGNLIKIIILILFLLVYNNDIDTKLPEVNQNTERDSDESPHIYTRPNDRYNQNGPEYHDNRSIEDKQQDTDNMRKEDHQKFYEDEQEKVIERKKQTNKGQTK